MFIPLRTGYPASTAGDAVECYLRPGIMIGGARHTRLLTEISRRYDGE